jgi:hypothetical protein
MLHNFKISLALAALALLAVGLATFAKVPGHHDMLSDAEYELKGGNFFCVWGQDCAKGSQVPCPTATALPGLTLCPTPGAPLGGCTGAPICYDGISKIQKWTCVVSCWPFSNPPCAPTPGAGAPACDQWTVTCRFGSCEYVNAGKKAVCGADDKCVG